MFLTIILVTTWILIIARLIIAIQLTRVGQRHKLSNLFWLAAFFYITGIGDIFIISGTETNIVWLFFLAVGLGDMMLVMFIQKTFYQDRKSPYLIFMVITLTIFGASLYMRANQKTLLPYHNPFNWLWLIWIAYHTYKKIATDQRVEDWVKARYKLIIAYSLAILGAPFYTILTLVAPFFPDMATWLFSPDSIGFLVSQTGIIVFVIIGIALEYLAWVMPESYRRYLNRNYQAPVPDKAEMELSEEEIMRRLQDRA